MHVITRLGSTVGLAFFAALPLGLGAQNPTTITACFVPIVGAIYLIKVPGLPSACLGPTHVEISWTDGAIPFGGTGAATSVARSDHTHGVAGQESTGVGESALATSIGSFNTALGARALQSNTTGSLNVAVGREALFSNTSADLNVAVGAEALRSANAFRNIAVGYQALFAATSGADNTAVGHRSLRNNQAGRGNSTLGSGSLTLLTAGDFNVGLGAGALEFFTTGDLNTGLGTQALGRLVTGSDNTAVGKFAGSNLTDGSRNIYIGAVGFPVESDRIRIGAAGNTSLRTFIAGIRNANVDGVPVVVGTDGQLGIVTSSRRVKQDVHDLGARSRDIMRLRPVRFRYTETATGTGVEQFGLIAEDVAERFPELAAYDSAGTPTTVRYHVLPVLLLNELQRQERELAELRTTVASLAAALDELRRSRK
jgi:hypothetical protein